MNFFFDVKDFSLKNVYSKNGPKNEFKDNNKVSLKIDFEAGWPREGHIDSVGVKMIIEVESKFFLTI